MTGNLMRADDKRVYRNAGYFGMWKHLGEEVKVRMPGLMVLCDAKRGTIKQKEDSPINTLLIASADQ